jgi:hypothetical protein
MSLVQADIKSAVTTTAKQLLVLENKLDELNLSSDNDEEAGPKEGKAEALQQLEEERKEIEASRTLLDELLLKAQEEAVAKAAAKAQNSSTTVTTVTLAIRTRANKLESSMAEFMGLFLERISIYRAMVEEGFIKSETNTISSNERDVVISYESRRHLYLVDSPPRMPEMTTRTLPLAPLPSPRNHHYPFMIGLA